MNLPTPTLSDFYCGAVNSTPSRAKNNYAILDSGATDHFMLEEADVDEKKAEHNPIRVTLSDNSATISSHECKIKIPDLPPPADKGYIVPGLKNHSLISVTKLCKAGCKVSFTATECIVTKNDREIMRGIKNQSNGLWYVPISNQGRKYALHAEHTANNVYHTATMAETIKFLHQCLFSPTVDTLCKAIDNGHLIGFPHLTSKSVRKYLPESTATVKGHLNRTRKGLRSTTKESKQEAMKRLQEAKTKWEATRLDYEPEHDENAECKIFVGATIGDQFDGTVYTDQTGNMPVVSYAGNKCHFVCYEYRSNAILVRAMKDQTDDSLQKAFQNVYEFLTTRGFKPKLNIMDNQCSKRIQRYIKSTGAGIQLVNPDDHRVNACERAIQTWKNHWIAGLNTIDPACLLQLWSKFIQQGQDTLNLLRKSRINPRLSAYAILNGQFDFNRTPLAPVGTKALVFLDPKHRKSFQSKALDAYYTGPAMMHYRNYQFFILETGGM
jgi:hypothetical protein